MFHLGSNISNISNIFDKIIFFPNINIIDIILNMSTISKIYIYIITSPQKKKSSTLRYFRNLNFHPRNDTLRAAKIEDTLSKIDFSARHFEVK